MLDLLALFFVSIIIGVSIPIAIFSIGYLREYKHEYSISYNAVMMLVFIACMIGVVIAQDMITFMVFWEGMSIISFLLVIYEYNNKETLKAGILYFIMTRISGLVLFIMFAYIYNLTGTFAFNKIAIAAHSWTNEEQTIICILALIGFGAKAGLIPLHAWLPKAHPAAPSNISALMSGVMIKVALYGFIRVIFTFVQKPVVGFGIAVMLVGAFTALFSILNGAVQDDLKKLLGYSSAENIGIIFSTVGLAIIMQSFGQDELATLSLTAALFHALNHAIFKSLLFTSAGNVLYATGTRNMNELGGLHKVMKFATICAFIGTVAVSAMPPLNGFASEIIIFQSFIQAGISFPDNAPIVLSIFFSGIFLALTSGLAVYAAIKAFGITFLSEPRTEKAKNAQKLPLTMNIGVGILASAAIIAGVFAPFIIQFIASISSIVLNLNYIPTIHPVGYDIILITTIMIGIFLIIILISKITGKSKQVEKNITWGCGFNNPKLFMQYSSTGYTQPINRMIGYSVHYSKEVKKDESRVWLKSNVGDLIELYIYRLVAKFVQTLAGAITKMHMGKIHIYIMYILVALTVTLLVVNNAI